MNRYIKPEYALIVWLRPSMQPDIQSDRAGYPPTLAFTGRTKKKDRAGKWQGKLVYARASVSVRFARTRRALN